MHKFSGRASALALAVGLALAGTAQADVVISQVYGGGGNSGAPLRSDFVELHNNGATPILLDGWSVQYAGATGTAWQRTNLSGTIEPGAYYLVKQADGASTTAAPLPTPDATGTIAMAGAAGKVALVKSTSLLTDSCPVGTADFVGYGAANCSEGASPTAAPSNTTAVLRLADGCQDSNNNAADFATAAPAPRNRTSPLRACGPAENSLSIDDVSVAEGDGDITRLVFTATLSSPAGPDGVRFRYSTADGTATVADVDYVAASDVEGFIAPGETSVRVVVHALGDTRPEADETFTVALSSITGAAAGDVTGLGTILNDDVAIIPISRIQGSGQVSPLVGQTATTRGIVTGRKHNGFFIQSQDIDADTDPATSEGLFVFTRTAPPVEVITGRVVQVTGTVTEFVPSNDPGQFPLTQLAGAVSVVVHDTASRPLPAPVELTTTFPHPLGTLDQLERLEGMRVTVPAFRVTAPTGGFTNESQATGTSNGVLHGVVAGVARPFREPGLQLPDPVPGSTDPANIPRWDFNPELLSVDTDLLGGPALDLTTGSYILDLTGPLDYSFRRYMIALDPAATGPAQPGHVPRAAKVAPADAFSVASYNLERFFDEIDHPGVSDVRLTPEAVERRMRKASLAIRDMLGTPDILGVVEVENLDVLNRLAARINADALAAGTPDPRYTGVLMEGNDIGGIDVGFLVRTDAVTATAPRVQVRTVTQVGKDTTWVRPDGNTELLNDRPPLAMDATVHYADGRAFPITAVVVHQRSLRGAEANDASGERIRGKRQRQAEFLAAYLQGRQTNDPGTRLVVVGDFNAFEFNDGLADTMNTVTGTPTPDAQTAVLADGADLVDPDLVNLGGLEPVQERYSFVFGGNAQTLDHVLVNEELIVNTHHIDLSHARINADFPETHRNDPNSPARLSDHDPVVAYFVPRRRADLTLQAFAPFSTVQAGTVLAFEVQLGNTGPDSAEEPTVGFAIDAELPALAVTAPANWFCNPPRVETGRTLVVCDDRSLAANASGTFTLRAEATPALIGRTLRLNAIAEAQSLDPNRHDNAASAQLEVVSVTDVGVGLTGPDKSVRAGRLAAYRVVVDNHGANLAAAPVLSLWGNAPASGVALPAPAGWSCSVNAEGGGFRATCNAQTLQPASSAAFDLQLLAPLQSADGLLKVAARIASASSDSNAANNEATHSVKLQGGKK